LFYGLKVQHLALFILLQNALGVAGTALLYKSLRKVHVNAALITSLIWAIYPIELFIESRFLAESLFVFPNFGVFTFSSF
jgi:hypothetical protein